MSNQIQFELASPQKMLFNKKIVMATVPGGNGRYGVLAGHAPMATTLGAGVVEIYENDELTITDTFFVTGGYCEVVDGRCSLLADQIIAPKTLQTAEIQRHIKTLNEKMLEAETPEERLKIEDHLIIERAKQEAVIKQGHGK